WVDDRTVVSADEILPEGLRQVSETGAISPTCHVPGQRCATLTSAMGSYICHRLRNAVPPGRGDTGRPHPRAQAPVNGRPTQPVTVTTCRCRPRPSSSSSTTSPSLRYGYFPDIATPSGVPVRMT